MAKYTNFTLLTAICLATTLLLWLPFLLRLESVWGIKLPEQGMATIVANYDGPYYIIAAKTLYDPAKIESNSAFSLPAIYYTAHYPLYPLLIRSLVTILPFIGYPYSMVLITFISGILSTWMLYILLNQLGLKRQSLWIALVFTIFPARWFIVRSIGSPEPLFLFLIMASVYFFNKEKWWLAGITGALAQATKPPGILLFAAYVIALTLPNWGKLANLDFGKWILSLKWRAYPILLIPAMLVIIFIFYGLRFGNFFAYFNSGDNIHLTFPPFQALNPSQTWVGTFWLEEIIWIYLLAGLGFINLIKQGKSAISAFVGVFFFFILFVAHRDIARYSLPLAPFLLIAFIKTIETKEFKWIMGLLLIPIYLFSIAFIANNITPISDWGPLL